MKIMNGEDLNRAGKLNSIEVDLRRSRCSSSPAKRRTPTPYSILRNLKSLDSLQYRTPYHTKVALENAERH